MNHLCVLGVTVSILLGHANPGAVAITESPLEEAVTVDIRSRLFSPNTVVLHAGRKTRLIVINHDSELHAFVPLRLFTGISLNLGGNGAPEFGPNGLKRVIIPPDGRVEIRFSPEQPGEYEVLCDMPGHEMRANIVVKHE